MAALDGADLSGSYLKETEFVCSDLRREDDERLEPCARLRSVNLTGATLDHARFEYADLHGAHLKRAYLRHTTIENSLLTDARFDRADLSGILVTSSDFSGAEFGARRTIDCHWIKTLRCPKLRRVAFFDAKMPGARFLGATIEFADFAKAGLRRAKFGCDGPKNNRVCTRIQNVCFHRAMLPRARFRGVTVSNVDFSNADVSGASFKNVRFENVVFPRKLSATAEFDDRSARSLERARVQALDGSSTEPDERPCTPEWRHRLGAWKNNVEFAPFPAIPIAPQYP